MATVDSDTVSVSPGTRSPGSTPPPFPIRYGTCACFSETVRATPFTDFLCVFLNFLYVLLLFFLLVLFSSSIHLIRCFLSCFNACCLWLPRVLISFLLDTFSNKKPRPTALVSWSQICLLNSIAVCETVRSYQLKELLQFISLITWLWMFGILWFRGAFEV